MLNFKDTMQKEYEVENPNPHGQFLGNQKLGNKLECVSFEMLFIQERKPSLNVQSDSIRAKLSIK